ncbi:MAG: ABC transporter transmembrane domain-containing protein, partial [Planctomycetota bacterium]|nr:ABC transporter transmembrane domain-containing protein [Planctomycetota bacterium]
MGWLRSLLRAFRRPFRHLRRRWLMVSIGLALVPVHAAVMLWMPRLLGQTLDLLTAGAGSDQLAPTCWLMLGLAGAEAAARFVSRRLIIDSSRLVEQQIKDELVAHIQRLPTPWFDKARTGDLTSRMTQDVELVRFVIGPMLLHGGSTLCLLPAGLVLMLSMDVPVAL